MKALDISGQRFGRLIAIRSESRRLKHSFARFWECQCDCGTKLFVPLGRLRSGTTKSCGCLRVDIGSVKNLSHGLTWTAEYHIWTSMIQRCVNSNQPGYKDYGGRGIKVCDRWQQSFESFLEDMGPRPSTRHTIDRLDNSSGYSKENCSWRTLADQANNKRNNIRVTVNGVTHTLAEWCRINGLKYGMVQQRIGRLGWDPARAVTEPRHGGSCDDCL